MKKIPVSHNGIISKTTLLVASGILMMSGINDIESNHLILEGTIKILLGILLIFTREYCKTIPNGETHCDEKPKRIW